MFASPILFPFLADDGAWRRPTWRHEVFLFWWQPDCVVWTLPQVSAEVSKTRSNRRAGLLYGFLVRPAPGRFTRVLSSVGLIGNSYGNLTKGRLREAAGKA
jgi:hypothetical protein